MFSHKNISWIIQYDITQYECIPYLINNNQVMYDKSDSGIHLRKYVHASLALWHNYKWASAKVLQVFGRDFIAPLFHQLFPDRSIDISSMSHSMVTTLLSYMRLSFSSFRDVLRIQYENTNPGSLKWTQLNNLWHLLEYFIPVVIMY